MTKFQHDIPTMKIIWSAGAHVNFDSSHLSNSPDVCRFRKEAIKQVQWEFVSYRSPSQCPWERWTWSPIEGYFSWGTWRGWNGSVCSLWRRGRTRTTTKQPKKTSPRGEIRSKVRAGDWYVWPSAVVGHSKQRYGYIVCFEMLPLISHSKVICI